MANDANASELERRIAALEADVRTLTAELRRLRGETGSGAKEVAVEITPAMLAGAKLLQLVAQRADDRLERCDSLLERLGLSLFVSHAASQE